MRGSVLIAAILGLLLAFGVWRMRPRETKIGRFADGPASLARPAGPGASGTGAFPPPSPSPKPTGEASPEIAREWIKHDWKQYDSILDSLGLAAPTLARLKVLLVERSVSADDAHRLATQLRVSGKDQLKAVAMARAQVDQEITGLLDPAHDAFVNEMLGLKEDSGELAAVISTYAPEFSSDGASLTGQQAFALAEILHHVGIPVAGSIKDQWMAKIPSVDSATGLSGADREILLEAGAVLNARQIEVLQEQLVKNTRQISGYIQSRWPAEGSPSSNETVSQH